MKEVAKLQIKDRTELFQATAISMGMQPNVIEKDFWVCFMLDHLFHDCKYKNAFVFKGGTSLSKSYHYCANPNGDKNDYVWETLKDFEEKLIWDTPVENIIQLVCNPDVDFMHIS